MRALFRLAPLVAFGPWFPLWAAEPAISLDLARVRLLADERSPRSMRASISYDLAKSQARRDVLGVPLVPVLSAAPGLCFAGGGAFCGEVSLSVPLPLPGEGSAARRVGEIVEQSAHLDADAVRASARTEAAVLYLELLAARALRDLTEDSVRLAQVQMKAQRLKLRTGDAAEIDRLQAEEVVSRRVREAARAQFDERIAWGGLRRALLLSGHVELKEKLATSVEAALLLASVAPHSHPLLMALKGRLLTDVARADLAAALRWPRLALQGTYQNEPGLHALFVGVVIPLTGLSAVARADLALAQARRQQTEREAELAEREIAIAREAALHRLGAARELHYKAAAAVARQRSLVAILKRAHVQKQLDLFRVLLAEEALLDSSRQQIRAALAVGRAALLVAAGGTP